MAGRLLAVVLSLVGVLLALEFAPMLASTPDDRADRVVDFELPETPPRGVLDVLDLLGDAVEGFDRGLDELAEELEAVSLPASTAEWDATAHASSRFENWPLWDLCYSRGQDMCPVRPSRA